MSYKKAAIFSTLPVLHSLWRTMGNNSSQVIFQNHRLGAAGLHMTVTISGLNHDQHQEQGTMAPNRWKPTVGVPSTVTSPLLPTNLSAISQHSLSAPLLWLDILISRPYPCLTRPSQYIRVSNSHLLFKTQIKFQSGSLNSDLSSQYLLG